jgi:hypothetical protein
MGGRLFTDKLVCGWLEVFGVWSLDSATQVPAYPAHASGSPPIGGNYDGGDLPGMQVRRGNKSFEE